ncbi:MAG TPA: ABC transporter permease [Bacilli bacterium]|nr:ABC transporter permease [Bacilli bacterium]
MKFRTLVRHVKEGGKNLARNGWMTFASISAVTIMLLVVGIFLVLILNLNHLASSVEEDIEIKVFIDLTATEEQQQELKQKIEAIPDVKSVIYVNKEEGLEQFIDSMDEVRKQVFELLRAENPFNDAFIVRADTPQLTEEVAKKIEKLPYIDNVNYGQDLVKRLFEVTSLARNIGLALIVGMMFTAMFLIANTIKITIIARKREIQIMKLVGATNWFIRWPFFVEGVLLGAIGSIIPIIVIIGGYQYIYESFGKRIEALLFQMLPVFPHTIQISLILLLVGVFIGVWGSMMSIRKFLKV